MKLLLHYRYPMLETLAHRMALVSELDSAFVLAVGVPSVPAVPAASAISRAVPAVPAVPVALQAHIVKIDSPKDPFLLYMLIDGL